eukprot:761028-Hanusia_phi.AAC.1
MAASGSSTQNVISVLFDILNDKAVEFAMQQSDREPIGMEKEFHSRIITEALRLYFAVFHHDISDNVEELPPECHLNLSPKYSKSILQCYLYLKRESETRFGGPRSIAAIIHQSYIYRGNDDCKLLTENLVECVRLYFRSREYLQEIENFYFTSAYHEFIRRDVEVFSKSHWDTYRTKSTRLKERAQYMCQVVLNSLWDIISSHSSSQDEFQTKRYASVIFFVILLRAYRDQDFLLDADTVLAVGRFSEINCPGTIHFACRIFPPFAYEDFLHVVLNVLPFPRDAADLRMQRRRIFEFMVGIGNRSIAQPQLFTLLLAEFGAAAGSKYDPVQKLLTSSAHAYQA